ncbi:MAG: BRO-N domain-containing protein [Candidatus Woesearchaeota archaeon]
MDKDKALVVFQDKKIRRAWFNDEWWFVAVDIIAALTDSKDPSGYLKDMRRRDEGFAKGWGQIATPLMIETLGGKQSIMCISTKGAFRLIQSIPSPKAEPFKLWLAQVGYERIEEIQDPELAQERMKILYEQKGYSKSWIDKRLRGMAVREDLTDEWKKRGVDEDNDFAILTAEISKASFDMTPTEYKKLKGLGKENLRDHMTDLELIFNMLGEASTAELERVKDPKTFPQHKEVSKEGGSVAKNARLDLEDKTKRPVISKDNYLDEPETVKRKRLPKS